MRTRLLAASLTALAAVSLAACSSSGSGSGSGSSSDKATAAAGSPTVAATTPPGATAAEPSASLPAPAASAPSGTSAPGTDGSAPAKPAPPTGAGLPAEPDADLAGKIVAALNTIDPAIVGGKPDQVAEQARKQCQAMYQYPKDKAKLAELAKQNFSLPGHAQDFGPDTAAKIDDALRATLCPPPR
ncbi:hypothetical protein AB0O91_18395 [Kitasatospora sp. NPDC089797]|uniref:hypothetical protein n=1 Tax=Kitasatospora sp. NPDC089797 TaxID=3155298 RepID=UPI0034192522